MLNRIFNRLQLDAGGTRLALHINQLVRFYGQGGKVAAEGFADDLQWLVQMLAGMNKVNSGLHGLAAAHGLQDRHHGIGMRQRVFTGVQHLTADQGLSKGARA